MIDYVVDGFAILGLVCFLSFGVAHGIVAWAGWMDRRSRKWLPHGFNGR